MAKVMVSIPDDLLTEIDLEAKRQGTSRSGLLQKAAKREIGLAVTDRDDVIRRLESIAEGWSGPTDVVGLLREDRRRNG